MSQPPRDLGFETRFYESVYRRDPSYAEVVELLGGLYTQQGRIAEGLKMDRRLVRLQPDNATAHYNLACSLALLKRRAEAVRTLQKAVVLGYDDYEWMEQDSDLASLHQHPEYLAIVQQLKDAG